MANWQPVMALADVTEGEIGKVAVAGVRLILAKLGDAVVAYEDSCPHEGHPLSDGDLDQDILICSKHLWEFEVRTGHHISRLHRPETNLNGFPTRVVDGVVEVDLAAPSNPRRLPDAQGLSDLLS